MTPSPRTSGFTIVRNAMALDYPFIESVRSLLPLVDEFVIACGESTDPTAEICEILAQESPKIRVISTQWDTKNQKAGNQLREQTDLALSHCRGDWAFYLQSDEVLHESDYPKIRKAIENADADPSIDGVIFDYLHFYASYDYEIRGREWYRKEVRAFKTGRGIHAFRDAQGFRKNGARLKGVFSDARVFHYGYVRNRESLKTKSAHMSRLWGEKPNESLEAFTPVRHVGLRRFTGTHPAVMEDRISHSAIQFDPKDFPRRWNRKEIKNALTLLWESVVPIRLGEFRNYDPA